MHPVLRTLAASHLLLGLTSACNGTAHAQPTSLSSPVSDVNQATPAVAPEWQPAIFSVQLNLQKLGDFPFLRSPRGQLLARESDLQDWRIRLQEHAAIEFRGGRYHSLQNYQGIELQLNEAEQSIAIVLPAQHFSATVLGSQRKSSITLSPVKPGGFLNYEWLQSGSASSRRLDAQFEVGAFNAAGRGTTGLLLRHGANDHRLIRLESSWVRDDPDQMTSLTWGDTTGVSGLWGRPIRFGGVRYGTNFATRPGFVTFPQPQVQGEAGLPSVMDVYVDGVRRQSTSVPPGPFQLSNLPVITGQGNVQVVMRDLLGREQLITQSYFATQALMQAGLKDDSYEIGLIRNNYGTRDADYGKAVAVIQRRAGITDRLTTEWRVEALRAQQTAGWGLSTTAPYAGIFSGAAALSHSADGIGELASLSYESAQRVGVNVATRAQWTSNRFTQLGWQSGQKTPLRTLTASLGTALGSTGSLSGSIARTDNRQNASSELVSMSYTLNLARWGSLTASAFKSLTGDRSHAVSVTYILPLGEKGFLSTSKNFQGAVSSSTTQYQENLPAGPGHGYRLLTAHDATGQRTEAGYSLQTSTVQVNADLSQAPSSSSYRLNFIGGIGLVEGHAFLTPRLNDSFGLVHLPEFPATGVMVNHLPVARTDAHGYAALPWLMPYQPNIISLDSSELPLETEIESDHLNLTPPPRTGLLIRFPVKKVRGARIAIMLDDGEFIPTGAEVRIEGEASEFQVALRGEAYVTGLSERNRLQVTWRHQHCELEVLLPRDAGPIPRLGPFVCQGVQR